MAYKDPTSPDNIESARASKRRYYLRNKEEYSRRNMEKRNLLKSIADKAKDTPCTDCGVRYPSYVMDFDHVNGDKIGHVAHIVSHGSERKLLEEIAKCEVVCSNCHRERTHARKVAIGV